MENEIEVLSEEIHRLYCAQYLREYGKPYWTHGDYSKLDERMKEYDRNIARWHLMKLDLLSTPVSEKEIITAPCPEEVIATSEESVYGMVAKIRSEKESVPVGCCTDCAYYLDYKDDWQCNGGVDGGNCKCHPDFKKDLAEEDIGISAEDVLAREGRI